MQSSSKCSLQSQGEIQNNMVNSHVTQYMESQKYQNNKTPKRELTQRANRKTLSNAVSGILFSSRAWIYCKYNVESHLLSSNPNTISSNDRYFPSPFQRSKQGVHRSKQKRVLHHFKGGWGKKEQEASLRQLSYQTAWVLTQLDDLGSLHTLRLF